MPISHIRTHTVRDLGPKFVVSKPAPDETRPVTANISDTWEPTYDMTTGDEVILDDPNGAWLRNSPEPTSVVIGDTRSEITGEWEGDEDDITSFSA